MSKIAMVKKERTKSKKYPGVYYRESSEVRHLGKPDRIYWITWYHAGKKNWLKIGSASQGITEEYAHRRRIDVINRLNLGENPDLLVRKKAITVDAVVTAYISWREAEGKYVVEDRSRYNLHVKAAIGSLALQSLGSEKLDSLKAALLDKLSSSSTKKVFIFLRAAVNLAIRRKKFSGANPFSAQADFAMPQEDNRGERFLTPEEAAALLRELEKRSTQLYHMALVALHTGMRATELFGLKGGDIHDGYAVITAKGGARETVFLPPEIFYVFSRYRTTPDALLFQKRGGGRIKGISGAFSRAVDAVGLNDSVTDPRNKVWFHTLRHTFASWLAQSGKVTLHELMQIMRHSRIETTLRYAHLIPGSQHRKLDIISKMLSQHQTP